MLDKKVYNTIEFKEDCHRAGFLVRNIVREFSFKGCNFDVKVDSKIKKVTIYTVTLVNKETGLPVRIDKDTEWYIHRAITEGVVVHLDGLRVTASLAVAKPAKAAKAAE